MNEQRKKGLVFVLITAAISGFSIFINKFGVKGADPYFYTFLKNVIAGGIIFGILLSARKWPEIKNLARADKIKLFWIGLIGGSIPFLLFFKGLSLTAAYRAGFIQKTLFIYVAILAFFFLKEKITKSALFGFVCMVLGSFLFLKIKPQAWNVGDLYVFLASIFWAIEIIIAKRILNNVSGTLVGAARLLLGSVFILAFLLFTGRADLFHTVNFDMIKWVIITGFVLAAYNFTFYNGLKEIEASTATALLTLATPITSILTMVFLDGTLSGKELVGTSVIVLGVVILGGFAKDFSALFGLLRRKKADEPS